MGTIIPKMELLPVAEHYSRQGKLHTVEGHGTVEEVFTALTDIIAKL